MVATDEQLSRALEKIGTAVQETGSIDPSDLSQDDASLLYTIGHNLYEAGDYEKAEPLFRRLVTARPLEPRNWFGLAACLQERKLYDEAVVGWTMASFFEKLDPMPHIHAAECLISLDKIEKAKMALTNAASLCEEDSNEMGKIKSLHVAIEQRGGQSV